MVFPSVFGIGIDLMDVPRIRRVVDREGMDFLREFLSSSEIDRCRRTRYPLAAAAAAFAAKEAFFKALGTGRSGKISWHDVEILGWETKKKPARLRLSGETSRLARKRGVGNIHLACSKRGADPDMAVVTVVLEGRKRRSGAKRTM